jgi:PAS domain S-box-containing protein
MNFIQWNVYQKYVSDVVLFNAGTDQKNISFWRNKIFLGMLSYLTPLSLIALIPGVYMSFTNNLPIVGFVDLFAFLLLIIILVKRKIPLQVRKLIFISVFYCLAIVLIYYVGKAGPGLLFLLATTVLSSIIHSTSAGYYSAWANTFICIVIGILNYFGIQMPVAIDYPLGVWIAVTSNLVILSFACAKCLDLLLEGLDLSLHSNKTVEEQLQKVNHLYVFISQVNQNIVRVKDEATLYRNSCKMAVEFGKFKMAWIGLFDFENQKISVVEECGIHNEDAALFKEVPYDVKGPQNYVLSTGEYFICNNIQNDLELVNWKDFCLKRGLNSGIVLPIKRSGKIIGTFNLYSSEIDFSGSEEIKLLLEVTNDISFALDLFEKTKVHDQTRILLSNNEKKFRDTLDGMFEGIQIHDFNFRYLYVNDALVKFSTYTREELIGFTLMEKYPGIEQSDLFKSIERCLTERVSEHLETTFTFPNGTKADFELSIEPIPEGVTILSIDRTEHNKEKEKVLKAKRLYAFISAINKSIVHIKDKQELLDNACKIAIDIGLFKMVRIDLIDEQTDKLCIVSAGGSKKSTDTILKHSGISCKDLILTDTPTGRVLKTGKFAVSNDMRSDPSLTKWKTDLLENDIKAGMCLPIKKFGKLVGVFGFYSEIENVFDEQEIALLEEATDDISFALENFKKTKLHIETEELVIKKEKRFRGLVENSADAVAIISPSGNLLYISPSIERVLGYSESEIMMLDMFTLFHPDELEEMSKVWQYVLTTKGIPVPGHTGRMLHKDGSWRWIEATVTNMLHDPAINGIVDNFRDVTDKIKAEELIVKNEKRFRAMIEESTDIIMLTSMEGKIIYGSSTLTKTFGYSMDELLNKSAFTFFHPDDLPDILKNRAIILETPGKSFSFQYRLLHKNGIWIWCEGTLANMFHEPGIQAFVSNFRDISERKLAEDNLQKSESRLNEAQGIAHLGNWELDFKTNVHTWSDELYNILGVNKGDVTPSTELFLSFIHPDDLEQIKIQVDEAFKTLKATSYNFRFIKKDGTVRYGYTERKFEFDKNNEPLRLLGVVQDITERKLIEDEREKMILSIVQHTKNLEQFASIVSHNLRAPVANILGLSNVLQNNISETDKARSQQFLFKATEQLDIVLKDLNKILQVQAETNEYKEEVNFEDLVNAIKSSIQTQIDEETVKITTDFSGLEKIISIKSYVHSIFYNLISNSIKYRQIDKASVIKIKSKILNKKIQLSFKDNGTGIDLVKHGTKLFGLYNRFHPNIEGKGIGLFMVKTQLETLGGSIHIKSKPGEGAEFIIELPFLKKTTQ